MRENNFLVVLLALMLVLPAAAQERRRPGEHAERHSNVDVPDAEHRSKRIEPKRGAPPLRRQPGVLNSPFAESLRAPTIEGRRQPGVSTSVGISPSERQGDPNRRSGLKRLAGPPTDAKYRKEVAADRWQLTRQLGISAHPWYDPYNQNTLKADQPLFGDWFFNLTLISDSVIEPRKVPTPVGAQGDDNAGQLDVIGSGRQLVLSQSFIPSLIIYKGDTTFKPPEWEFRFTAAYNLNYARAQQARALQVDPREGTTRTDDHFAVQELFVDRHLRNVSDRYDFDSLRAGIQPFTADFRGFLFLDQQLGLRLFGTRDNNRWQYNLAYFRRIEKDTNSGLNDLGQSLRKDDVYVANVYRQDFPVPAFTSQAVVLHNRNREGQDAHYNNNGFIERPASLGREAPRNYQVTYLGLNGDGHFGRCNLSSSFYGALGDEDAGVFVPQPTRIRAFFAAAEASMDFSWQRYRLSALYASGDHDPYDSKETGFDAVLENPLFAGFDTSYWIRQAVPLIGGGGVSISGRNGVLNSLRSSKDEGQSNFTNPGTILLGAGADFDLTPRWRVSGNVNQLWFAATEVVEAARAQADISHNIGTDVSASAIWRPLFNQNIVLRVSGATLLPGAAYRQLFGNQTAYSVLVNLVLTY